MTAKAKILGEAQKRDLFLLKNIIVALLLVF